MCSSMRIYLAMVNHTCSVKGPSMPDVKCLLDLPARVMFSFLGVACSAAKSAPNESHKLHCCLIHSVSFMILNIFIMLTNILSCSFADNKVGHLNCVYYLHCMSGHSLVFLHHILSLVRGEIITFSHLEYICFLNVKPIFKNGTKEVNIDYFILLPPSFFFTLTQDCLHFRDSKFEGGRKENSSKY